MATESEIVSKQERDKGCIDQSNPEATTEEQLFVERLAKLTKSYGSSVQHKNGENSTVVTESKKTQENSSSFNALVIEKFHECMPTKGELTAKTKHKLREEGKVNVLITEEDKRHYKYYLQKNEKLKSLEPRVKEEVLKLLINESEKIKNQKKRDFESNSEVHNPKKNRRKEQNISTNPESQVTVSGSSQADDSSEPSSKNATALTVNDEDPNFLINLFTENRNPFSEELSFFKGEFLEGIIIGDDDYKILGLLRDLFKEGEIPFDEADSGELVGKPVSTKIVKPKEKSRLTNNPLAKAAAEEKLSLEAVKHIAEVERKDIIGGDEELGDFVNPFENEEEGKMEEEEKKSVTPLSVDFIELLKTFRPTDDELDANGKNSANNRLIKNGNPPVALNEEELEFYHLYKNKKQRLAKLNPILRGRIKEVFKREGNERRRNNNRRNKEELDLSTFSKTQLPNKKRSLGARRDSKSAGGKTRVKKGRRKCP